MAKKKSKSKASKRGSAKPRSFSGVVRGRSRDVQSVAKLLRNIVLEEIPDAEETFYGGQKPMAMYRTLADVCWIQPLTSRCNVYFTRGIDLNDPSNLLEGSSDRIRHVKVKSVLAAEELPLREWIRESVELNESAVSDGLTIDEVLEKLRDICLSLPKTKETMTWGKPHFRVAEKIFCGCGEKHGAPAMGLKLDPKEAKLMMGVPGIEKAPYSRPNDGWISINPNEFADWDEINRMVLSSYRIIAPKKILALLDQH